MTVRIRLLVLLSALAMLSVRALTPLGYMPATAGSGLLYELCPDGMPAEIMQSLAGGSHHHHHGSKDGAASESCPIGHMLASTVAVDIDVATDVAPDAATFPAPGQSAVRRRPTSSCRCRSPPA